MCWNMDTTSPIASGHQYTSRFGRVADRFRLASLKRINLVINLFKLFAIPCVRIDAAAFVGDPLEGFNIERILARRGRITDRNGYE